MGFAGTNSADVKNLAHGEQSHCLFREASIRSGNRKIAANLVETRAQQSPYRNCLIPPERHQNGTLTAITFGDPS
jgi:hypothetical protein